jgi:hypothetical protein
MAYIPTYMGSKMKIIIQPTSSVIPSLGVSDGISNPFLASHVICPTTSLHKIIPLTCPSYTYTLPPYSPTSQNKINDPLINHVMQTIASFKRQFSTMNQNNYGFPIYYIKVNPLSLDILRMSMPQGIAIPRFKNYNGKGNPTSHFNTFVSFSSDFFLHERLLAQLFSRNLREFYLELFFSLSKHSIHSF